MKKVNSAAVSKKDAKKSASTTKPERLTKDDLKALRTNVKGGRSIPARCCEYMAN